VKLCRLSLFIILAASVAVAGAQDAKEASSERPKAPEGWKYVVAKDNSYQFLFPTKTARTGTRERTMNTGGLSGRVQANYCTLRDGMTMTAEATNLSGAALKGLKIADVYKLVLDGEKKDGGEMSEPAEVMVGKLKGQEYTVTSPTSSRRSVLIVVKGRIYHLTVAAKDNAALTSPTADTFLKSLFVVARTAPTKDTPKDKDKTDAKPPAP